MAAKANPIQVQKALKGVKYPAPKRDLIATARRNEADQTVLSTLERIPDQTYQRPSDVAKEIGKLA